MSGKRTKEPIIADLRIALEHFHDKLDSYGEQLDAEAARARAEPEPNPYLVRALERQIAQIRRVSAMLDDHLWLELVSLANGSGSIEHTRTGEFF
jgi:hypothetical protein